MKKRQGVEIIPLLIIPLPSPDFPSFIFLLVAPRRAGPLVLFRGCVFVFNPSALSVVEQHIAPDGAEGYSIEVFNAVGDTIAVTAVPASALTALGEDFPDMGRFRGAKAIKPTRRIPPSAKIPQKVSIMRIDTWFDTWLTPGHLV